MRNYLSLDREVTAIRLRRSIFSGSFLLVEGSSDKSFYERFINKTPCELVTVSGKPSSKLRVIGVLEILEKSSFQGVLAIVDADFDRLQGSPYNSLNLLRTDSHDLETMLIDSPAFNKVISELGSEDKIIQFNRDIKETLLVTAMPVSYLLWVSNCDELNLTFSSLKFSKFVDKQTLQIDELKLIRQVNSQSQESSLKDEDLQKRLMSQKNNSHDPWQVCCGHHLVEILSVGLRNAIGSNEVADVEPNSLERNLRLAYEEVDFRQTQLYSEIRVWESNNQPFKVLKDDM